VVLIASWCPGVPVCLRSARDKTVRAADLAMDLTTWSVIVPLILALLLSGLVQALGTTWGLFRHYWVLVKLLLPVFATIILLLQMPLIGYMADIAAEATLSGADRRDLRSSLVVHAAGGLLVLLVAAALSVYKPRYGGAEAAQGAPMNTLEAPTIRLFYETHGCGLSDVGTIGPNAGLA
jgi:hypothetical protein